MSKESFIYWLENNRKIASYSVNRYANAIDIISSELDNFGLDRINLYSISDTVIIDIILANTVFQQKNSKVNRMYSASLNHFKSFIEYGNERQFQAEFMKDEIEYEKDVRNNISTGKRAINIEDKIQAKPSYRTVTNRKIWTRNPRYASDVVVDAEYLCEYSIDHVHFKSKYSQKNYVEAHHLIPMKYQELYDNSLDIYSNIVSLCMVCHKILHFGMFVDKKEILDKLFEGRRDRLINSGINISISELYQYYQD
jgi:5-methylcytosine-specific restriction enzyme A